jgi:AcrR family transcriptional regulator
MSRTYTKTKRAEKEEETRQRIVEAAVELHEQVGGVAATVTAIADRAGVGRVTYYRHFPDERSLLQACTGHYLALNPPPDPSPWAMISNPEARLRTALGELYAFYGRTAGMLARAEQEAPSNPVLAEAMAPFAVYLGAIHGMLTAGWSHSDEPDPVLHAVIGHALAFATWRSLVREHGLSDEQAIALMIKLARGVES